MAARKIALFALVIMLSIVSAGCGSGYVDLPDKVNPAQIGDWQIKGGSDEERQTLLRIIQSGDPSVYPLARSVSDVTAITIVDDKSDNQCKWEVHVACVQVWSEGGDDWSRFDIYIQAQYIAPTRQSQSLVWHELGHAIQYAGLDRDDVEAWYERAQERNSGPFRLDGKEFRKMQKDGELDMASELWADHFAMYATRSQADETTFNYVTDDDSYDPVEIKDLLGGFEAGILPWRTYSADGAGAALPGQGEAHDLGEVDDDLGDLSEADEPTNQWN